MLAVLAAIHVVLLAVAAVAALGVIQALVAQGGQQLLVYIMALLAQEALAAVVLKEVVELDIAVAAVAALVFWDKVQVVLLNQLQAAADMAAVAAAMARVAPAIMAGVAVYTAVAAVAADALTALVAALAVVALFVSFGPVIRGNSHQLAHQINDLRGNHGTY